MTIRIKNILNHNFYLCFNVIHSQYSEIAPHVTQVTSTFRI